MNQKVLSKLTKKLKGRKLFNKLTFRVDYKFPQHIDASESCKDLIKKWLEKNFDNRIKLEDIMLHEFFDQSYPELMPLSSLNCPPSLSYIKSFLIDKNNPFKWTYQSIDEVSTNYLAKWISNTRKAEKIDLSLIERNMESSWEKVKYINTENDFTKEYALILNLSSSQLFNLIILILLINL